MGKRDADDELSHSSRCSKKLKSSKSSKKSKKDNKIDRDDGPYATYPALEALPQTTVDEFMTSNAIQISGVPLESQLRPIISFDHLPSAVTPLMEPFKSFTKPTSVQSITWPYLFAGRDVIGVAETGSGKTLAFGLPCVARVMKINASHSSHRLSAVIVTPTRELAMQIYDQLEKFSSSGVHTACIYGGASKDDQRRVLKKASIAVATPGRLKDLLHDGSVDLSKVKYLVLDEADRMLDKGFEQDIKEIISATPASKKRQTVMFTATWPMSVRKLAATFMTEPVTHTIGGDPSAEIRANSRIKQIVEVVDGRDKEQRLNALLNKYTRGRNPLDKILIFCLYKKEAMRIERFIRSRGFQVAGIHGDLSQTERFRSLNAFKSGAVPLLVATDVAARGLDIPAVKLVLNVTFPLTVEDYVHRIGRTGRAGADGLAITLFTENDKAHSGG
ncbi:RNA-dependent ATPase [Ascosphaera aggregata]|nr:RNA-dependent ATPase [Ascosphaera aggregata]